MRIKYIRPNRVANYRKRKRKKWLGVILILICLSLYFLLTSRTFANVLQGNELTLLILSSGLILFLAFLALLYDSRIP